MLRAAGKGLTILRAASGKVAANGRYDKMFYLYLRSGDPLSINKFHVKDMTLDKNGSTNGTPPTDYGWEQAHLIGIAFQTGNTTKINSLRVSNVEFTDKVGAGINIASQQAAYATNWGDAHFVNLTHGTHDDTYGHRGDVECSQYGKTYFNNCNLAYIQIETMDSFEATDSHPREIYVNNSTINSVEVTATALAAPYTKLTVDNLTTPRKLTVRHANLEATNSDLRFIEYIAGEQLNITDSTIKIPYNDITNEAQSFYPNNTGGVNTRVEFRRCTFELDTALQVQATGFCIKNNAKTSTLTELNVLVDDCTFDARIERVLDAYANGSYEVRDSTLNYWGRAFGAGAYSGFASSLTLSGNTYSGGNYLHINRNNTLWSVQSNEGITDYFANHTTTTGSQGVEGYQEA